MKPEIKEKWLEALRSGNYKQGTGKLRQVEKNGDTYCCLGVLCDVLGVKWHTSDDDWDGHPAYGVMDNRYINDSDLPDRIRNKVGLTYEDTEKLIHLNDGGFNYKTNKQDPRRKFPTIAKYIEQNF